MYLFFLFQDQILLKCLLVLALLASAIYLNKVKRMHHASFSLMRSMQLGVIAVLVLAVCGKLALDLLLEPAELYSLSPVAAE